MSDFYLFDYMMSKLKPVSMIYVSYLPFGSAYLALSVDNSIDCPTSDTG